MNHKKAILQDEDLIDGELQRVTNFNPLAVLENGKVLKIHKNLCYATVDLESKKFLGKRTGYIYHPMDFRHLWAAFKERGVKENEEVLIFYSKKNYKKLYRIFSIFLPRLWVMICPKNAFDVQTDENYKPELTGEARWIAFAPIKDWKPEVME